MSNARKATAAEILDTARELGPDSALLLSSIDRGAKASVLLVGGYDETWEEAWAVSVSAAGDCCSMSIPASAANNTPEQRRLAVCLMLEAAAYSIITAVEPRFSTLSPARAFVMEELPPGHSVSELGYGIAEDVRRLGEGGPAMYRQVMEEEGSGGPWAAFDDEGAKRH